MHDDTEPAVHRPDVHRLVAAVLEHVGTEALLTLRAGGGFDYTAPWDAVLCWLTEIGGVDLNVARLFEGHLNAVQLVGLYGTVAQQEATIGTLRDGGLLGVWGADGSPPVSLQQDASTGSWQMAGSKRYASGAGLVRTAIVPVNQPDGVLQLLLLPVEDDARIDLSSWNMRGMRGSASGTYRFDGMEIGAGDMLGGPDDYRQEPFFVGGIWRCAAAQLGAIEALVKIMAVSLKESGRDGHPLQMARIGNAIIKARTARLWIEDAAERVETYRPADGAERLAEIVALSAYGRLLTEEVAMGVIDLAERALGLGAFALGHPAETLMRDLAVYIRQANPDAVLLQHGRVLAGALTA